MTRKIGRYEILGPLATGGMAEILLAKLVGPSGFERPVVIKRIRQDLDHQELVGLFLEEARLAAKVRHANVVAVEDLGTDEGLPYLVMEYLEGESLSNVARRLKAREEKLPFGLIAYILAEACAGLHAAHELKDADGAPIGLVHRDVSPQNVFVTYDGAVKVVDFGIARAEGSPQTEPGTVRGKFGYMSPEQLNGDPIDRRTDVFTLGIVLYECLTGHRLFKRFNAMGTMRAVVSDPIVAPRRVEPTVPKSLEAICLKALSRPLDDRYATAAEMRRELLLAMRELVSEEPSAELAELMVRCFPDRIGDKRTLLRNVREGSVVDHIPTGDVDVTIELPGIEEVRVTSDPPPSLPLPPVAIAPPPALPAPRLPSPDSTKTTGPRQFLGPPAGSTSTELAPTATELDQPPRRRSRATWGVLGLLVLVGAGVGTTRLVRAARKSAAVEAPAPLPTVAASTAVVPPPSATVTKLDVPAPAVASSVATSPPPPVSGVRKRPPSSATNANTPAAPVETAAPTPSASTRGFRRFQ